MFAVLLVPLIGIILAGGALSVYLQPKFIVDFIAKMYPEVVFSVRTTEKVIALTIDDAPTHRDTPIILDILKEYDAQVIRSSHQTILMIRAGDFFLYWT